MKTSPLHVGLGSQLTEEQEKSWEQWVNTTFPDDSPRFELIYNDSPIYIDMLTLLQCLKIAEHTHHIPPIDGEWWVNIIKQYPVEIHLDGRIQAQSE
ncbi:hypothetical protein [Vibrio sp. ArtGut-C1]|uniref:hypothetical protein n=1 Tax=Vibrio sp. ArtGut-C1 TaxID=2259137 RepID=UPI000A199ED0|nr:hypothetical protein [Vibrio sp. ArtGut-C1]